MTMRSPGELPLPPDMPDDPEPAPSPTPFPEDPVTPDMP